jgi:ribosomal protein S3
MYPIEELIQDWCNECNVPCMTILDYKNKIISVISDSPGILIGKNGTTIDKYRFLIEKYDWNIKIIEADEVHYPGNNWNDIVDARVKAYFETETEEYDDFEEYDGFEYEIDDIFEREKDNG